MSNRVLYSCHVFLLSLLLSYYKFQGIIKIPTHITSLMYFFGSSLIENKNVFCHVSISAICFFIVSGILLFKILSLIFYYLLFSSENDTLYGRFSDTNPEDFLLQFTSRIKLDVGSREQNNLDRLILNTWIRRNGS